MGPINRDSGIPNDYVAISDLVSLNTFGANKEDATRIFNAGAKTMFDILNKHYDLTPNLANPWDVLEFTENEALVCLLQNVVNDLSESLSVTLQMAPGHKIGLLEVADLPDYPID